MEGQEDFHARISNHPYGGSENRAPGAALPKPIFDPFPKLTFFLIELWVALHNVIFVNDRQKAHFLFHPRLCVQKITQSVVSNFVFCFL